MMYAFAKNEPVMMIFLTEQDVKTMRPGRTVFLDIGQKGLPPQPVSKAVISLHKDAEAIKDVFRKAGQGHHLINLAPAPEPESDEESCAGCGGIQKKWQLHIGKCIICWYKMAMQKLGESN